MFQQRQIKWFSQIALDFRQKTTPTDWNVLVLVHTDSIFTPSNQDTFILQYILKNLAAGTDYNETFTTNQRFVDNTQSDERVNDTLTVNTTVNGTGIYAAQGAINVIGIVCGHKHVQTIRKIKTINTMTLTADNPTIYHPYVAERTGDLTLEAGNYYVEASNGTKFGFTVSEAISDVKHIVFNDYEARQASNSNLLILYDSNGVYIRSFTLNSQSIITNTEGYTKIPAIDGEARTIDNQKGMTIHINTSTRRIWGIPYGFGIPFSITY